MNMGILVGNTTVSIRTGEFMDRGQNKEFQFIPNKTWVIHRGQTNLYLLNNATKVVVLQTYQGIKANVLMRGS